MSRGILLECAPEATACGKPERGTHSMVKEFKTTRAAEDGDYRRD